MRNTYAQNKEDLFVLNYFGDYKGILLSIGENDGLTFSNARLLIENGWKAHLIEPGSIYDDLSLLYHDGMDEKVSTYKLAIGDVDDKVVFFDSGAHVLNGNDKGLVSTTVSQEMKRWPLVEFQKGLVWMKTFKTFLNQFDIEPKFDFISIDCEGADISILQQIDLESVGCRCLIVEWNSDQELAQKFTEYCTGFKVAHVNAENLIFVK